MTGESDVLLRDLNSKAFSRIEGSRSYRCLSLESVKAIARTHGLSTRQLSIIALKSGIVPSRYIKNMGTFGLDGQARLLESSVIIAGAGGIGGRVAELLARMGLGSITLVDPDIFDESNLNRQDFSGESALGKPKVEVVSRCLSDINSDVEVHTMKVEGGRESLGGLLKNGGVVIDALDNIDDRLELEALCKETGSILIHGAIAGDYLQAMTIYPGDSGLSNLMRPSHEDNKSRGIEIETGNPSTTPAAVASIQAHEALSILAGKEAKLRGRLLYMDLDSFSLDFIDFPEE